MEELSKLFARATKFSKLDLKAGYGKIKLDPSLRYLTGMIIPKGLNQSKMIAFGLASSPACFQKIIREITHGLDAITNPLEDIFVIGYGEPTHKGKLDALLNPLSKRNATLN